MEKLVCSADDFSQSIEEMINCGATVPLYVSGNSMTPFLVDGRDIVRLRACTQKDFRRRQILLFRRDDRSYVLHRVIKVLPDGMLLMNGDAQTWCEKTDINHVVAAVYEIERNGKICRTDSFMLMLRDSLWMLFRPFRKWLMALWRRVAAIRRKRNGTNYRNDNTAHSR